MSYARWSEGDVYIFRGANGAFNCLCCPFEPTRDVRPFWAPTSSLEMHGCFSTESRQEMLTHLKKHQAAGHEVPARAIRRLERELHRGSIKN